MLRRDVFSSLRGVLKRPASARDLGLFMEAENLHPAFDGPKQQLQLDFGGDLRKFISKGMRLS